jgi:uncharacterized protein YidB (DUF937 family)
VESWEERKVRTIDWNFIKKDFVTGTDTLKSLSQRYGVSVRALSRRVAKEGWRELRKHHQEATFGRALEMVQQSQAEKMAKMEQVSGELLGRISEAISQLDLQVLREVRKEKDILYENPQRSDKATKEVVVERESLSQVRTPVDRNGIKLLAAALKDVKEVQMLRDPGDLREQEAKINKLLRDARETSEDHSLTVSFSTETEECSL